MPTPSPAHNAHEYSVSELSGALKRSVEERFGYVRVRGELSGCKRAASGHMYLDLKDDASVLNAVCWKATAARLPFKPEDGMEVICTGKLTTYGARSSYQLVVDTMEIAGAGALMALLEKRKAQLAAEGLFDPARKRPLPFLPETIGVITSPTGAVIRDILHRISERFPVHVLVWPVLVQGEGAATQIANAISGFNELPMEQEARSGDCVSLEQGAIGAPGGAHGAQKKPDLLIVARGGGSLEDLWAFNEEVVVRAAAASRIPLISAVGHETDTTLIDYAADRRAPTPTAAAEMAVPVRAELLAWVREQDGRLYTAIHQRLTRQNERVAGLARGLPRPESLLAHATQRLDDRIERLSLGPQRVLERRRERLEKVALRLNTRNLLQQLQHAEATLQQLAERGLRGITHRITQQDAHLLATSRMLASLDYRRVLERGYVVVKTAQGRVVTRTADARGSLTLTFHDGDANVSAN